MDPRTSILTRWRIAFCRAYHDDYGALLTRMDGEIERRGMALMEKEAELDKHRRMIAACQKMNKYFIESAGMTYSATRKESRRANKNLLWAVFFFGLLVIEAFRVAMGALQ